ncbi:MAG: DUF4982 domain-containing protein [Chitinispirillaceae bacterium]|nr:DUF4982 domain-containing protein [Chitinispirillaceae bacterium]
MKKALFSAAIAPVVAILAFGLLSSVGAAPFEHQNSNRIETQLDTGWLYNDKDVSNGQSTSLNETGWMRVCVPHANIITKHAFFAEQVFNFLSWYRKHITPSEELAGRRFLLEFEAVSISATVYVNGTEVGSHRGAYTPFTIDVTDQINAGRDNLIAVRVDSRRQSDVPPEGGGIDFMIFGGMVRNVNLIVVDPLYVEWIFASNQNPSQSAPSNPTLTVKTRVNNGSSSAKSCVVTTNVVDKDNNVVATVSSMESIAANRSHEFSQTTPAISNPMLWTLDTPYLYTVYTQVQDGETYVDEYRERIGIRTMTMNKSTGGFYLNGKQIKLFGQNRHETYPYLGRAAPKRLQRKDADILKYEMGCNMVRTSHYPQAPDFFDRCDEIGLIVLEEIPGWMHVGGSAWKELEKQVLRDMIIRDRNHPSIFTWGVRVNESADDNVFYGETNDIAHELDPSRLTCGVRRSNSDPATSFLEDIWTQNFIDASPNPPNMPVITSEEIGHGYPANSFSREDTLVNQALLHAASHNKSYGESKWGGVLGWCAFDYASGHSNAVEKNENRFVSNHGAADIFRILKFAGYFYQSQRDPKVYGPMVHIANFWRNGSPNSVVVFSNCDQVELFVNGTSQKKISPNLYNNLPSGCYQWNSISYSSGNLKAVGYINNQEAASHTWHTPGSPTKVTLTPDTSAIFTGGDMTRVVIMVADDNNPFVPYDKTSVTISVSGAGDFIGESPIAMENGVSAFYVRSRASETGEITCRATASNVTAGSATVTVVPKPDGKTATAEAALPAVTRSIAQKSIFKRVMAGSFVLPRWAREGALVRVYDLSGKLVYRTSTPEAVLNLSGIGAAGNVYLLRISPEISPVSRGGTMSAPAARHGNH